MEKYVFYVKGKTIKVLAKKMLSAKDIENLKQDGFKKHHLEVEAKNEKDAGEKLNELNEENLHALSAFTGNMLFPAIIFIAIFFFVFYSL